MMARNRMGKNKRKKNMDNEVGNEVGKDVTVPRASAYLSGPVTISIYLQRFAPPIYATAQVRINGQG